jgi:metallo-beta-lactamase family protein
MGGAKLKVRLNFIGAAQNVTGSSFLLESNNTRILVDCGLYQERKLVSRNWEPFPVDPASIDAVLLTHAHLDHCGLLPKLVRDGFRGNIYCTEATAEITQIILIDSARLQEEDAQFKKMRHEREGRKGPFPEIPLYTVDDAKATFSLFSPVKYKEPLPIGKSIKATFCDAGHVLGSSMIKIEVNQDGERRTIIFSGDVGRWNKPILQDPTFIDDVDYMLVESTYGDRVHKDVADISERLTEVINSTRRAGGNIVVPSFALERSQEILYYMNQLLIENRIPHLMVFLDSPMAISITEVFKRHSELYDKEMTQLVLRNKSPFEFPNLVMTQNTEESKAINHIKGTVMVIAGSGMCTGGRIKHHLVANISKKESTILFVGYQAVGTLGRHIIDGAKKVRILGNYHPVKARIEQIHGFSSHADRNELYNWLSKLKRAPRSVFIVHGEERSTISFSSFVKEKTNWNVIIPRYGEEFTLE